MKGRSRNSLENVILFIILIVSLYLIYHFLIKDYIDGNYFDTNKIISTTQTAQKENEIPTQEQNETIQIDENTTTEQNGTIQTDENTTTEQNGTIQTDENTTSAEQNGTIQTDENTTTKQNEANQVDDKLDNSTMDEPTTQTSIATIDEKNNDDVVLKTEQTTNTQVDTIDKNIKIKNLPTDEIESNKTIKSEPTDEIESNKTIKPKPTDETNGVNISLKDGNYTTVYSYYTALQKIIQKNVLKADSNNNIKDGCKVKLTILKDGNFEYIHKTQGDNNCYETTKEFITKAFPLYIPNEIQDKFPRYFKVEIKK